ncbi:MAG: hypothetical protein ABI551_03355 [Polyangiaceae bacterium]
MSFAKRLLVLALGLAIWLVAPKAFASAPRCDVRAATTFAPPPFLEDLRSSVDLGVSDCGDSTPLDIVHPGNVPVMVSFTATPNALLTSAALVVGAPRSSLLPRVFETHSAPSGISTSIERPPEMTLGVRLG